MPTTDLTTALEKQRQGCTNNSEPMCHFLPVMSYTMLILAPWAGLGQDCVHQTEGEMRVKAVGG